MTSLVLIPWGETSWHAGGRLASRTPLPLTANGRAQAGQWGEALGARELSVIFASSEQASQETATLIAERSEAKRKHREGLEEIDFGLWEGLTEEQLNTRYSKLYKAWVDDPAAVCIPDGEDVAHAAERIAAALRQIVKKHRNGPVGAVLGPTVLALGRCEFENAPISRLREFIAEEPVWYELDTTGTRATTAAPA